MTKVLIVEDTPNFRRRLLRALPGLLPGCEAHVAADAAAAEAEVAAATPDVILLDLGLPRDGRSRRVDPDVGLALLRHWRQRGLPSRIVILSSHTGLAPLCHAAGADGFVAKDTPLLLGALQEAVGKQDCPHNERSMVPCVSTPDSVVPPASPSSNCSL